jgi:hypothetical protein
VLRFISGLRVVTRLSTGVFKGAIGSGTVPIIQGAHFPRIVRGVQLPEQAGIREGGL